MKNLNETIQQSINESLEGMLQSRTDFISKNGEVEDLEGYSIIRLKKPIKIGLYETYISGVHAEGDMLMISVGENVDGVKINYFSDETLKLVIKELDAMIKKL